MQFKKLNAQTSNIKTERGKPVFLNPGSAGWVDSVFKTMSYQEKIGQLFMVAAYSNRNSVHTDSILKQVNEYGIGGLIFFQGGPVRQAQLTNLYQSKAKIPLLISIDGEWGLSMRLDSTMRFPRQMTLGAITQDTLIYLMGKEIARQCNRLGIHINLAPVADINNNPRNPVISSRSFGEDKNMVARKAIMYMNGMQDNGIMANAKHFPGHGDTDADSHYALPLVSASRARLDSLELFPFREMMKQGLASMMVAHLNIPALDSIRNNPSTLSREVVTGLLKNEMNFQGLVFTDALNMKGVSSFFPPGMVDLKALLAGNDVLLFPENVPKAMEEIHYAIQNCLIEQSDIDERVKKILASKFWAGLNKYRKVEIKNLYEDLNTPEALWLNFKLHEAALTLLSNQNNLVPLRDLQEKNIAALCINETFGNPFQEFLSYYAPVDLFAMPANLAPDRITALTDLLGGYSHVIVSVHNTNIRPDRNYGISAETNLVLSKLAEKTNVILVTLGNAYALSKITETHKMQAVIIGYEDTPVMQKIAAQSIFGGTGTYGKLPVRTPDQYALGTGIKLDAGFRLKYTHPEELGLSSAGLSKIDSIVNNAISSKAMPGCQVLVSQYGKVLYYKSFGNFTYDKKRVVTNTDLYDLASITKIAASGLAAMKLYDSHKLDLDKRVSRYLPDLKKSDKGDIEIRDLFTHQAGLQPWKPFWMSTMTGNDRNPSYYSSYYSDTFSLRVAEGVFLRSDYPDSLWHEIVVSPLTLKGKMVYSDFSLLITQKIIEKRCEMPITRFVETEFYKPLGLGRLGYNPLDRFPASEIAPTENDVKFRKQLIQGDVHDPTASMMGGIAGHAGLFSNASDLAVIMQMLLQNGEYADIQYLKKSTIQEFTRQQFEEKGNRRGLIFDKPEMDPLKVSPASKGMPGSGFGHTGFTGTCVWADPDNQLIFVFLSNRVHPDAANNKLVSMNVRTEVQQVVYDMLKANEVKTKTKVK